jgi:hypothetical protein
MNNQSELEVDVRGNKRWYLGDELHREDGPAVEWIDGDKWWFLNGKLHRTDGPAVEGLNENKYWYLNNKEYTHEKWFKRLTPEQQWNYLWNLDE